MKEIWKYIKGTQKLYKISNYGNVYSMRSQKIIKRGVMNRINKIISGEIREKTIGEKAISNYKKHLANNKVKIERILLSKIHPNIGKKHTPLTRFKMSLRENKRKINLILNK